MAKVTYTTSSPRRWAGQNKEILKKLEEKEGYFKNKYGTNQYNAFLKRTKLDAAYEDIKTSYSAFKGVEISPSIAALDKMYNKRDYLRKKYGDSEYERLYRDYFKKASDDLDSAEDAYQSALKQPKLSTLQQYGVEAEYGDTYEDQIRKVAGAAPVSFDASKYMPEGSAVPDRWDDQTVGWALSGWRQQRDKEAREAERQSRARQLYGERTGWKFDRAASGIMRDRTASINDYYDKQAEEIKQADYSTNDYEFSGPNAYIPQQSVQEKIDAALKKNEQARAQALKDEPYFVEDEKNKAKLEYDASKDSKYEDKAQSYINNLSPVVLTGLSSKKDQLRFAIYAYNQSQKKGTRANYPGSNYGYLTPEQIKTAAYYMDTDEGKALEYVDSLDRILNSEAAQARQERIEKIGSTTMGDVGLAAASILTAPSQVTSLIGSGVDALGEYRPADPNAAYNATTQFTQGAREEVTKEMGDTAKFFANLGFSAADMGTALAAGGTTAAPIILATEAAGATSYDTLQRGGTYGQAFFNGLLSGATEYATEAISFGNLGKIARGLTKKGARQAAINIAKQAGIEGGEEVISHIGGTLADIAVMGDKSNYNLRIKAYMAQGMSEEDAVNQTNKDFFFSDMATSFASGVLLGGLFGAGAEISSVRKNTNIDEAMRAAGVEIDGLTNKQLQDAREQFYNEAMSEISTAQVDEVAQDIDTQDGEIAIPELPDLSTIPELSFIEQSQATSIPELSFVEQTQAETPVKPEIGAQDATGGAMDAEYQPKYTYEIAGTVDEFKNTEQDYVYDYSNNTEIAREEIDAYKQYVDDMRNLAKQKTPDAIKDMEAQADNVELIAEASAYVKDPRVVTEGLTPSEIKELGKYAVYKRYARTELLNMAKTLRNEVVRMNKESTNKAQSEAAIKQLNDYISNIKSVDKIAYPKKGATTVETIEALEAYRSAISEQLETLKKIAQPAFKNAPNVPNQIAKQYGRMIERQQALVKQSQKTLSQIKKNITTETNRAKQKLIDIIKKERKGKKLTTEYRNLLDSLYDKIDTVSRSMKEATRAELYILKQYAKETYTDQGMEIPKSLQDAYSRLEKAQVSEMTVPEIEELTNQILEAKKQDQIDRKEARTLKGETIAQTEESIKSTVPKTPKFDKTSFAENPQTWGLSFGENFRRRVIDPIQQGSIKHGKNERYVTENIIKPLNELIGKEFGNKKYGNAKKQMTSLDVELAPYEILEVYAAAKDANGFDALVNDNLYDPVKLQRFVKEFENIYPKYHKAYGLIRQMFEYYLPQTNETYNHIKGRDLVTEKQQEDNPYYYQLSKGDYYFNTPAQSTGSVNITPSFTYARTGGGKIDLVNPLWVVNTYHQQANRYVSYSSAIHDANILMQTGAVKETVQQMAKTKEQANKITRFMREYLYGVARGDAVKNNADKVAQKARSNVSGAILTLNIEVAAKQNASYYGALEHIDAKYLLNPINAIKALKTLTSKKARSQMYDKNPDLYERIEEGYLLAESGKLKGRAKLVRLMDAFTVFNIAHAAESQAKAKKQDASEIFHRALWDTQPMYDAAFRSSLQRSETARWFLQFSTQQFQQQNQVKRAVKYFKQGDKTKGTRALVGVALNFAVFSSIAFGFVKAFPKKEDDEKFIEQVAKAATGTAFPIFSRVLGGLPNDVIKMLGGDFEVTSGYDLSNPLVDTITQITNATINSDKTAYGKVVDLAKPILTLAGVPARNAEKWLSRTAEVMFPDFKYDYIKKPATPSQMVDDYVSGKGEFPTELPDTRVQIYDDYYSMIIDGLDSAEKEKAERLEEISSAISDSTYSQNVKGLKDALDKRAENKELGEYTDKKDLGQYAYEFYADKNPLNDVPGDISDTLSGFFKETSDKDYLIADSPTFEYKDKEYEYPDDVISQVLEGGNIGGDEYEGLKDIFTDAWFNSQTEDQQKKIVKDQISDIIEAIESVAVEKQDPWALLSEPEKTETTAYKRFNTPGWEEYGPDDKIINQLDSLGVYPKDIETFSAKNDLLQGSYTLTEDDKKTLSDMTYKELLKLGTLDAESAKAAIDKAYADFKKMIIEKERGW